MNPKGKARGFTLIELLVVIAIILLLAAILFPVFARARESARRASCQSNLKQMGLGMQQYTQDYDERFPQATLSSGDYGFSASGLNGDTTFPNGELPWSMAIQPYVKSYQIFNCPSNSEYNGTNARDYSMNGRIMHPGYGFNKLSSIDWPAETYLLGETPNIPSNSSSDPKVTNIKLAWWGWGCANAGTACLRGGLRATSGSEDSAWHLDGANMAFVDGHVKWVKREKLGAGLDSGTAAPPHHPVR